MRIATLRQPETAENGRSSKLARSLQKSSRHRRSAVHEIEVGEAPMFTLDAIERSRITVALVTLVATAAASLVCVAAAVGPALA
ncbi:MAG TPA: hypothetical protein VGC28_00250 [Sphingomonas sp.]